MSELLPGALDDFGLRLVPGTNEIHTDDGRVIFPMFLVAAVARNHDGTEHLASLSPLVYTLREASAIQEQLTQEIERSAILWIHRLFEPDRDDDQEALVEHRRKAADARAEGAQ